MAFSGGSAGGVMAGQSPSPFAQFRRSPSPNPAPNPFNMAAPTPNPFASAPQQHNPFAVATSTNNATGGSSFQQQQNGAQQSVFGAPLATTPASGFGLTGFGGPSAQPSVANGSSQPFNPFGPRPTANASQASATNPFNASLPPANNSPGFGSPGSAGTRPVTSPAPKPASSTDRGKTASTKPGLTEKLAAKGKFISTSANGQYAVTKGKPSKARFPAGGASAQSASSHQNPFQALSDAQSSAGAVKPQQGNHGRFTASAPIATLEEYATAAQAQLQKDRVSDLTLPRDFFDPSKRATLAHEFRRNQLEKHKTIFRESLERGGLIDIKDKQIRLEDAIDFRGTCEDMCPVYEVVTRVAENTFEPEETELGPDGKTPWPAREKFVKRHARSSAGDSAVLPNEVRTMGALERTTDYLLDEVLQSESNLKDRHGFLWDRFRGIRRDFTFQSRMLPEESLRMVGILEHIARFHAISHHLLAKKDGAYPKYSSQQEREAFQKTLISLKDAYSDLAKSGIQCKNEAEFMSYWILFFAYDTSEIQQIDKDMMKRNWLGSNQIQTAISLAQTRLDCLVYLKAKQKNHRQKAYVYQPSLAIGGGPAFLDMVADQSISYTMACVAEMSFATVRSYMLQNLVSACARGKDSPKDITPQSLQQLMRFDTEEQVVEFATARGLELSKDGSHFLVLKNQKTKLIESPTFSHVVERKRCNRPLLEVIRNNVFMEGAPADAVEVKAPDSPEGMFVDDFPQMSEKPAAAASAVRSPAQVENSMPLSFGTPKPNGVVGSFGQVSVFSQPSALGPSQGNSVKPGPAASAVSPKTSLFAPTAAANTTMQNPFGKPSGGTPGTAVGTPKLNPFGNPTVGAPSSTTFLSQAGSKQSPFTTAPSSQQPAAASSPKTLFPSTTQPSAAAANASSPNIKVTPPTPQFPSTSFGLGAKPPPSQTVFDSTASTSQPAQTNTLGVANLSAMASASTAASTGPSQPRVSNVPSPSLGQPQPAALDGTPLKDRIAAAKQKNGFGTSETSPAAQQATPAPTTLGPRAGAGGQSFTKPGVASQLAQAAQPAQSPPAPQPPKVDLMGLFAQWFVHGDGGMMDEFRDAYVEHLVRQAYQQHIAEEEARKQKEEDDREEEKVRKFRTYSLGVKFFYRWRDIARNKALGRRATQGRDMMKAFRASLLAQAKADKAAAAAKRKAEEVKRAKDLDREAGNFVEDLRAIQQLKQSRHQSSTSKGMEEALLATGVFNGLPNPEKAAADVIRDDDSLEEALLGPRSPSLLRNWKNSISKSASRVRDGAMAVFSSSARELPRRQDDGREDASHSPPSRTSSLSRSLPPKNRSTNFSSVTKKRTASPAVDALDRLKRPKSSGLKTSHFRLRAMGMVHMPNGQYLHESIAKPMLEGKRFPGIGDYGLPPVANGEGTEVTSSALPTGITNGASPPETNPSWRSHAHRMSSASGKLSLAGNLDGEANMTPQHKRKRPTANEHDAVEADDAMSATSIQKQYQGSTAGNSPSGVKKQRTSGFDVAEAERVIQEMRETAALMEEGETWYREQSELLGQGHSPWN